MPNVIRSIDYSIGDLFGAIGLPAVALALLAGLAGCTGPGAPREAPPDTVRFTLPADPQTLNPLFAHADAGGTEQQLARLSFEPFVDIDAAGRPVPALLAVIPTRANGGLSADGRTIVYRLRPGVRWSDGIPVTSADVLFTLHAILDPRNPVRSTAGYDLIAAAAAPDARTVVLHLHHAWAPAVTTYFSYGLSPQYVLPAHVLRDQAPLERAPFNASPTVGDGPYAFAGWRRGDALRYDANPRYWRGKPPVAHLEVAIVPEPSTNLLLLQSGRLDWNLIAPAQYAVVKDRPNLRFVHVPTSAIAGIAFNLRKPPLDDARVRRAIAMSIDRDQIVRAITLGMYVKTDAIQPRFSWAFDRNVHQPGYDPAAADAVFAHAGWVRGADGVLRSGGKPMQLTYVAFPESVTGTRTATAVQADLARRGIEVTIKSVSNAQLFMPKSGVLATGNFDLAYVPWIVGSDPDDSMVYGCGAPENYSGWCDPAVARWEKRALDSQSTGERSRLYAQIERRVASEVPILFLFDARYLYAYDRRLHGFSPNPFIPTWNAWNWRVK